MRYYDVFNGDADGICALHQLRLADPIDSILVTGLKREIALLGSVPAADGDLVTVLDISLDRNREALEALLERGAVVHYFDHHYAGTIPAHPRLLTMIDGTGASCTSALIDRYLGGRFRAWAVVGAFGDGLDDLAVALALPLGLDAVRLEKLREVGIDLNYNAYGQGVADILVMPADLYRTVSHYVDPFELADREPLIARLGAERREDLDRALALQPLRTTARADAWMLPDEAWARRVSGTFANRLALAQPHSAHAVLTRRADGSYLVSVRSPRASATSAVDFCRRFPTGGGRVAAAGIDRLESSRLDEFLEAFCRAWPAHEEIPEDAH